MSNPSSYSLLELNQYIRRVITLNFDEPLWIECEIGQASFSRGHWYLDLIQKEEQTIVAQCQAAMWANVYFFLKKKSPVPPEDILKQGVSVKLKVNVDFHERYGLKLIIEDVDSSFTFGQLELQRQAILKAIGDRGLIRKNAATYLSPVVQRLAVISSQQAAGYKDFVKHITDNDYGYDFRLTLFESAMQGQQVETDMLECLTQIAIRADEFDAVAIIRGGGARTDLAAFDNLNLAVRIADFPIPVFIGIGHEIDQSVLDLVAYQSMKTPTAVADFILERNAGYEGMLDELGVLIRQEVRSRLNREERQLMQLSHALHHAIRSGVMLEKKKLDHALDRLRQASSMQLQRHQQRIAYTEALLMAMDPDQVLARGYTITSLDGHTLTSAKMARPGMTLKTTFLDGTIQSKIE